MFDYVFPYAIRQVPPPNSCESCNQNAGDGECHLRLSGGECWGGGAWYPADE